MRSISAAAIPAALFFALSIPAVAQTAGAGDDREAVLKTEEAFRLAKIANDTAALDRLLADEYYGINQWGAKRDKAELIALFRTFPTERLDPSGVTVRLSGDHAIVEGSTRELSGGTPVFTFMFLRVYVRRVGTWRLLSSVQFIPSNP
jgi:hypothetical protein